MARTGASLNWGGFDRALKKAARKQGKALMTDIGEALVSGTVRRFMDEEDPAGNQWPPSQRASGQGGQTLTDTARLRQSIDYAATPSRVMVGSNVVYARIHQMGGKAGKGRKTDIPARPFLGVSTADMEEVRETLKNFLAGAFTP